MKHRSDSIQAIINILTEQVKTYKVLHALLRKERTCLIDIDPERITGISKEKDTVVMRLRLLEDERIRLIRKFVEDNEISGAMNLKVLAKLTGNDIFNVLRSRLLSLLQSIDEMNKFNSILIDRSINYIRTNQNFVSSFTHENVPKSTGVLLSRET